MLTYRSAKPKITPGGFAPTRRKRDSFHLNEINAAASEWLRKNYGSTRLVRQKVGEKQDFKK